MAVAPCPMGDHICPMFWSAIPQGSCTSIIFPNPSQRKAMGLAHIVMLVGCGSQFKVHASSGTQHVHLQQHLLPNSGKTGPRPTLAWQILSPGKHFSDKTGGLATGLRFVLFAKKRKNHQSLPCGFGLGHLQPSSNLPPPRRKILLSNQQTCVLRKTRKKAAPGF